MVGLNQVNVSGHCRRCNAGLEYTPGATAITCRYCGEQQPILTAAAPAQAAASYQDLLRESFSQERRADAQIVRCGGCGAETTRPANVISERCPFCNSPALSQGGARLRTPDGVLPFYLDEARAREAIQRWHDKLWFRPAVLFSQPPAVHAVYLPYWSFDWDVTTDYVLSQPKGPPRSGQDRTQVNGSMILASRTVPIAMGADLEPWDLEHVVAFNPQLLLGVSAETHGQLDDLARGAALSLRLLDREVDHKLSPEQQGAQAPKIVSKKTVYNSVRYRLLLLPVWTASYVYQGKSHRILVNARLGEVVGERPVAAGRVVAMFLGPFPAPLLAGAIGGLTNGGVGFGYGFWGTLAAQSVLILLLKTGKKARNERHGQFFIKREGEQGTENFAETMSGLMQNDPESRQEVWRFFGFIGLFLSMPPLIAFGLYDGTTERFVLLVAFHLFSAAGIFAIWFSYHRNAKEKRRLLGLDDKA